ncbi:MAG: N-formylglutamate amidohydrolase [Alphaproteobacteria bacterium]|nr:N-formylglutamate amidohydrolase [Alphaproteobacteria bacterium]
MTQNVTSTHSVLCPTNDSGVMLLAEHAGAIIPPEFEGLGIPADVLAAEPNLLHDTGVADVVAQASALTGTPAVLQHISRLVVDTNRLPLAESFIAAAAHGKPIAGNTDVSEAERKRRMERYYWPFHNTVNDALAWRKRNTALIGVHSYTPHIVSNAPDVGVLYWGPQNRLVTLAAEAFKGAGFTVGMNTPYDPSHPQFAGKVSFESRVFADGALYNKGAGHIAAKAGGKGDIRPHVIFEFALPHMQKPAMRQQFGEIVAGIIRTYQAELRQGLHGRNAYAVA